MAETSAELALREQEEAERAEKERLAQVDKDMDADVFTVVAPMVMLKVRDPLGAWHFRGFNESGQVRRDDIEEGSLRHHLNGGQLAPADSDAARFAGPSGTPKPGEPPNVPLTEEPVTTVPLGERLKRQADAAAKSKDEAAAKAKDEQAQPARPTARSTKEDWINYAVASRREGVSEKDARDAAESMTIEQLKAAHATADKA